MARGTENTPIEHANLINNGTTINGDIVSSSDIRLDGVLNGNLSSKGKVIIGKTGKVTGEVTCKNSDIEGSLEGKINVSELLSLKQTCNIKGDIITAKIAVEPGAKFTGTCNMSGNESSGFNAQRSQEEKGKVK
jgi:cytoskeletal protein CcmA (bactofilin family)